MRTSQYHNYPGTESNNITFVNNEDYKFQLLPQKLVHIRVTFRGQLSIVQHLLTKI